MHPAEDEASHVDERGRTPLAQQDPRGPVEDVLEYRRTERRREEVGVEVELPGGGGVGGG